MATRGEVAAQYTNSDGEECLCVMYDGWGTYELAWPERTIRKQLAPRLSEWENETMWRTGFDGTWINGRYGRLNVHTGQWIVRAWSDYDNAFPRNIVYNHADDMMYMSNLRDDAVYRFPADNPDAFQVVFQAEPGTIGHVSVNDEGVVWFSHEPDNTFYGSQIWNFNPSDDSATMDYIDHGNQWPDIALDPDDQGWAESQGASTARGWTHARGSFWAGAARAFYLGRLDGYELFGGEGGTSDFEFRLQDDRGLIYRRPVTAPHEVGAGESYADPMLTFGYDARLQMKRNGGREPEDRRYPMTADWTSGGHSRFDYANRASQISVQDYYGTTLPKMRPSTVPPGELKPVTSVGTTPVEEGGNGGGSTTVTDGLGNWFQEGDPDSEPVSVHAPDPITNDAAFGMASIAIQEKIFPNGIAGGEAFGDFGIEMEFQFLYPEGFEDSDTIVSSGAFGAVPYAGASEAQSESTRFGNAEVS